MVQRNVGKINDTRLRERIPMNTYQIKAYTAIKRILEALQGKDMTTQKLKDVVNYSKTHVQKYCLILEKLGYLGSYRDTTSPWKPFVYYIIKPEMTEDEFFAQYKSYAHDYVYIKEEPKVDNLHIKQEGNVLIHRMDLIPPSKIKEVEKARREDKPRVGARMGSYYQGVTW